MGATIYNFDEAFELFKSYDQNWKIHVSDSTYFELKDWFDATYHLGSEEENSEEASEFADYVWNKIHENEPRLEMKVQKNAQAVSESYMLVNMNRNELLSLLTMIKSACLPERQTFNRVKEQIEMFLEV